MTLDGECRPPFRYMLAGTWLTVAMSVLSFAPVRAQSQSTYPPAVENQCRGDYFRYCSPYALGSDELRRCMEANGKTLSSPCKQALKDAGYVRANYGRRGG